MNKQQLIKKIQEIEVTFDYLETYNELYNTVIDYMNDTQDFSLDYFFEDFVDYETAEVIAKSEMEKGGLIRMYYFLGDANMNNELFRIDGYGNLKDITIVDLNNLKEDILKELA